MQLWHDQELGIAPEHLAEVRFDPRHHPVRHICEESDVGKQFDSFIRHWPDDFGPADEACLR